MSIRIPGRSPLCSREGMVLPIVLVCGVLLVSMVISFQFVSASDYKRVARLNRAAQATALADLAADEVHAALADMVYGSTASTPAPWVKTLMEDLRDSVLSGGIAGFQDEITFAGNQIPATTAAAADAETFVEIDEIKATVNNFRRVGNLFPANTI